jgi:cytochrome c oxidase subunit IV
VVVTAALMLFIPTEQSLSEFVVLSVTCLVALATGNRLTIPRWAWVAGGALCAALLLVKVSTGPVLLAVLMISAVVQRRREAVALLMSSFIAWVLVLWVLLGQSLTDLPGWLRGAVEIAFGHTSAMSIGTPGGAWQYGVLAVVLGTAAMAIGPEVLRIWRSDRQAGLHAIAAVLIVALLAWFFVKQGFVRRDGHAAVFFAGAVIATAVLTAWQRLGRVHLVLLSTSCMLALVGCLVIEARSCYCDRVKQAYKSAAAVCCIALLGWPSSGHHRCCFVGRTRCFRVCSIRRTVVGERGCTFRI